MKTPCLMCGGVGGDEPPASALPFGLMPGAPFEVHFTPTFSKDSSLTGSSPSYAFLLTCSETAMRLAKALADCYSECIKHDGACAACFMVRVSLRLEGEAWELSQELSDAIHAAHCTHRGPVRAKEPNGTP